MVRAGSPSKSMMNASPCTTSTWPRWKSPCTRVCSAPLPCAAPGCALPRAARRRGASAFRAAAGSASSGQSCTLPSSAERRVDLLDRAFAPCVEHRVVGRLRREIRLVGGLRQHGVQLGRAGCRWRARTPRRRRTRPARLPRRPAPPPRRSSPAPRRRAPGSRASSPSRRPGCGRSPAPAPTVCGVPCLVDADHLAEQRRGVAEAALGQEAGHLAFRVHAGQHAAHQLQHQRVADDPGGVALLGREAADLRVGRQLERLPCARSGGTAARRRRSGRPALRAGRRACRGVSASMAKASVRIADARAAADAGQRQLLQPGRRSSRLPRRGQAAARSARCRPGSAASISANNTLPLRAGQRSRHRRAARRLQRLALGGEPAALRQIGGQRLALRARRGLRPDQHVARSECPRAARGSQNPAAASGGALCQEGSCAPSASRNQKNA